MSSELIRLVTERVDAIIDPVRRTMGDGTPAERTALEVVRIVEECERELAERWIPVQEAADRSGYSYHSVVAHAKTLVEGGDPGGVWSGMEARRRDDGRYEVRAGSVPVKAGQAA